VLYEHVNNIAKSYGTEPAERRDAYVKAAKDFRMPYWDWALQTNEDVTLFPWEVWSSTTHSVIRPDSQGKSTPMSANPLASYKFGSKGQSDQKGAINMVFSLFTFDYLSAQRSCSTQTGASGVRQEFLPKTPPCFACFEPVRQFMQLQIHALKHYGQ
jgi:Common central domain of tyrosinase